MFSNNWDYQNKKDMKFLFQLPCCSCFCFVKGKKSKDKEKDHKSEWQIIFIKQWKNSNSLGAFPALVSMSGWKAAVMIFTVFSFEIVMRCPLILNLFPTWWYIRLSFFYSFFAGWCIRLSCYKNNHSSFLLISDPSLVAESISRIWCSTETKPVSARNLQENSNNSSESRNAKFQIVFYLLIFSPLKWKSIVPCNLKRNWIKWTTKQSGI